ncbi:hypothetical protein D3C85_1618110 [compost metagenome]
MPIEHFGRRQGTGQDDAASVAQQRHDRLYTEEHATGVDIELRVELRGRDLL